MRIVVGITGASGSVYALHLLRALSLLEHEVHAVVSEYGRRILAHECRAGEGEIRKLVNTLHPIDNLASLLASGSFRTDVMVVIPCSMRTLAAIASGLADNLLCRTADVVIKERKNLILAVRETPLSAVHLENMLKLARLGVGIVPLCPGFYHKPQSIDDLVSMMVGRIMDSMGLASDAFPRWEGISGA
ncbi:putative UbiX-like flavin prenyltransferase [Deltaproteobacteria bacterium]|nr:putative UbiX-like flavin prenyltransferase [Deltaproteobacteria bacterium]